VNASSTLPNRRKQWVKQGTQGWSFTNRPQYNPCERPFVTTNITRHKNTGARIVEYLHNRFNEKPYLHCFPLTIAIQHCSCHDFFIFTRYYYSAIINCRLFITELLLLDYYQINTRLSPTTLIGHNVQPRDLSHYEAICFQHHQIHY